MQRFLSGNDARLIRFSGIVIAGIILDFALRLIIQIALAAQFGAGALMDAYLVAMAVPLVFLTMLVNPLNQSLIPILSEYREKKEDTDGIISSLFNLNALIVVFLCIIGIINSRPIIFLVAPGFRDNDSLFSLACGLFRLLCFIMAFGSLGGLLAGVYRCYQRFLVPSFIPAARSALVLGAILIFSNSLGIFSIAAGQLIAWGTGLAVMFIILFKGSLNYSFVLRIRHPAVKKIGILLLPLMLASFFSRSYILVDRYLASCLSRGSISYLNYAFAIAGVPLLISTSVSVAIFPLLSEYKAKKDFYKFGLLLKQGLKATAFLVIPAMLVIGILRVPLVTLLYERGAFTHHATLQTSWCLFGYLPWLAAFALSGVFIAGFYALGNVKIPLAVESAALCLKVILSLFLIDYFSHIGLALASSLALLVKLPLLWIFFIKIKKKLF
jgi:putative peptidoglycan lipid II flippase